MDEKFLSKKYRIDAGKLIRAWKHGLSDQEISKKTGIKLSTINLIRQDIELVYRKSRLDAKKQELLKALSFTRQRPYFF